jgi:O-acetyl-ADP-ribose deacetylase (regulator of RNase III)
LIAFSTGSLRLELLDGDIATQDVDAVVNAANNHFWMGAGVAGALKARGGQEIEREAMALGPVEPGHAVVTTAGRLRARRVIHAAVMGQDLVTSAALITKATRSSLELADAEGMSSIAFPLFGTGVGGFSVGECSRHMLDVIATFHPRSLTLVRVVAFGLPAYRTLAAVAAERLGPALPGPVDCPISG